MMLVDAGPLVALSDSVQRPFILWIPFGSTPLTVLVFLKLLQNDFPFVLEVGKSPLVIVCLGFVNL